MAAAATEARAEVVKEEREAAARVSRGMRVEVAKVKECLGVVVMEVAARVAGG